MAATSAPAPRRGSKRKAAPAAMSLRAYARRIDVDPKAVRKAIACGRLRASLGRTGKGQPCIADPELADREWAAGAAKPKASGRASSPPPPPARDPPPPSAPPEPPPKDKPDTLTAAQLRVAVQREEQIRLSNLEKTGALIDADQARHEAFECARAVRDALLNIPDRLAAELAAESDAARVHDRLDAELRAALESLAEALSHGE